MKTILALLILVAFTLSTYNAVLLNSYRQKLKEHNERMNHTLDVLSNDVPKEVDLIIAKHEYEIRRYVDQEITKYRSAKVVGGNHGIIVFR